MAKNTTPAARKTAIPSYYLDLEVNVILGRTRYLLTVAAARKLRDRLNEVLK